MQCSNVYCTAIFNNQSELKLHHLVSHKATIMNSNPQLVDLHVKKQHRNAIDVIKGIFTSENKKLDNHSPPIANINLDYYECLSNSSK